MSFIAGLVSPLKPFLSSLWAVLSTKSEPDSKRKVKFAKGLIHVKRLRSALELFAAFFHGESGGLLREYRPRTLCIGCIADYIMDVVSRTYPNSTLVEANLPT